MLPYRNAGGTLAGILRFRTQPMPHRAQHPHVSPKPGKDEQVALLKAGIALQQKKRFAEAEYQYQSVLRASPRNPDALNLMGTLALEARQPKQAIAYFEKALKALPRQAGYINNLGTALLAVKDYPGAAQQFRRALMFDPGFVDAMCNLARVHKLLNQSDAALTHYEKALALAPELDKPALGLADVRRDRGEMDEATALYRRVIARGRERVQALVGLAAAHRFTGEDREPALMQELLAAGVEDADARVALRHALGKAFADLGQHDAAFAAFAAAKEETSKGYDLALLSARHDHIIGALDAAFFAERRDFGLDSEQPVFIVGMPRSGTTLTEQICASHSQVSGAGELPTLGAIAAELGATDRDPETCVTSLRRMTAAQSRQIAKTYLEQLRAFGGNAKRITDKMPHNFEQLGLVALLFPRARVIHCRRAPVDACFSCFTHPFNEGHGYNTDLNTLGLYYREYRRITEHWHRVLPNPPFDSSYEDLVGEQEARSRSLIAHLGLEWEDGVLDFHQSERLVKTPSRWQVRQPIYRSSVKGWHPYRAHLGPLLEALGPLAAGEDA
jgi:tetratricopeptide (TPR) repeat protein